MIKIITWLTKILLLVLTALFLGSCHIDLNRVKGSGNITVEKRNTSETFTKIDVSDAIDVTLIQADKIEIIVEADDNLQKSIRTEVKNGTLTIANDALFSIQNGTRKVIVRMPNIDRIDASSASNVHTESSLKGTQLDIKCSSASSVDLNLEMDQIQCKASSGSSISMKGLALNLTIDASSGSQIEAEDLLSNEITVEASSGSSVSIHPIVNLKADASSGASISYNSTPKSLIKKASSGGSIDKN